MKKIRSQKSFSSGKDWVQYYRAVWRDTPNNLEQKWTAPQ